MNESYLNSNKNTALLSKPSRVIYLLLMVLFVLLSNLSNAQTISATTYPRSVSTGLSLVSFTSSGTLISTGKDDTNSLLTNIGFDFWFNGTTYTQFGVSANGYLKLGSVSTTSFYNSKLDNTVDDPKIAPFMSDLTTGSNGYVKYGLNGTAPNRTLIVEWKTNVYSLNATTNSSTMTFQAILSETTGKIQFIYGIGMISNSGGYSIGFSSSGSNLVSMKASNDVATYGSDPNSNQTTAIVSGKSYVFEPQIYKSSIISANTGSTTWCAGETRNVTVTIKNTGTLAWADGGGKDFNIGVKWNTNGTSWPDYNVRVDAQNLAPGATATYSFPITASNNVAGAYTTPLASGTNNLTFDVVYEPVAWFGNNNNGVGPGNAVYTTVNQTINALPATPTSVTGTATICPGGSANIKGTTSAGTTIDWYNAPIGGILLGSSTSGVNLSVSPTATTTYYAEARNTTTGCVSSTRATGVIVTVNVPAGDQTTYGNGSWIGYVYASTSGSPPTNAFTTNYEGYITQPETFNYDLGAGSISGPNLCGTYANNFAVRYRMTKNMPAGNYTFTVGGDDGYRLYINGTLSTTINDWTDHSYGTKIQTVYLSGSTNFILEYFETGGDSRASFAYTYCPIYELTSAATATAICGSGTSTVTLNSTTMPAGTYTVTYSTTNPATSGNTASMTFSGGSGTFSTNTLSATSTITITALASNSCSNAISSNNMATVTVNRAPSGLSYTTASASYCYNTAIAANSATLITAGTPAATYSVSPTLPSGLSLNTSTGTITGTPTVAAAATNYTVTAANSCGNTTAVVNITVNPAITATISGTTSVCSGDTQPKITFTNPQSYGVTIYYNINGGSTLDVYVNANSYIDWVTAPTGSLGVFNYNLVSVSNGSCSTAITGTATVTVNSRPTVTFTTTPTATSCTTTNVTYTTQSGMSNYLWVIPGVLGTDYSISSGGVTTNTVTLKWITAGSKTVTVNYTASGCYASSAASITTNVEALPTTATISGTTSVCIGDAQPKIKFTNSYSYPVNISYNINGGAATTVYVAANSYVEIYAASNSAGVFNYNLVSISNASNSNPCSTAITGTATVTVNSRPTVTFTTTPTATSCTTTNVTYTTQSGMSNYLWVVSGVLNTDYSIISGGIGSGSNTVTLKWLTSGSKTVTVNYTASGCYASSAASNTTNVEALPTTATISGTTSVCTGASKPQITISNPYSYPVNVYYNINGGSTQGPIYIATNSSINYIYVGTGTAGVYNYNLVSVSNASNGNSSPCSFSITGTATVTIGVSTPIIGATTNPSCSTPTGSVVLSGLPSTGTWTITPSSGTGLTGLTGTGTTTTVGGLAANTNYTFTVTNAAGCTSLASPSVVINSAVAKIWNGTWSPVGVPTKDDVVIIDGDYNTSSDGDLNACSLTIKPSRTLTVTAEKFVVIQNDLTVNGTLDVLDKGSLVMVNDAGKVSGTGTTRIHKFTTATKKLDFVYWSTPVASTTIATTFLGWRNDRAFEYDNDNNAWKYATAMAPAKGYIITVPNPIVTSPPTPNISEVVFQGQVNNGVKKIEHIVPSAPYLIGNPYPSAIDAEDFLNENAGVIEGTIYFWTHNTAIQLASNIAHGTAGSGAYAFTSDDYAAYNIVGGVATSLLPAGGNLPISGGSLKPTGQIASCQGFFASSNAADKLTSTEIVFKNAMRLGSGDTPLNNTNFFRTKASKTAKTFEKNRLWLNLTNTGGAFKQLLVGYVTNATNDYESRFDGESFAGNQYIDFYSVVKDKNLTIQGRALPFDEKDAVPLGYNTTIEGAFTISIDEADGFMSNQSVFLEDKLTNTVFDLKTGNYTFNTAKGTFNDRFVLKYSNKTLGMEDVVEKEDGILALYASNYQTLIIHNKGISSTVNSVTLFNMTGQKIGVWDVKDFEQTNIQIPIKDISSGIYIVKIATTKGDSSKKIVVN